VTLTNRHNPTGRLADETHLHEAATAARDAGARLLVDESYAPYVREAGDGPFGGPSGADLDGVAVTGSLAGFFGLSDLRLGWLVAERAFVERARAAARHVPAVAGPSRALGKRALTGSETLAGDARERLRENAETLRTFVAEREDVTGEVPDGSPFALLDTGDADGDQVAAAAWEAGVLVVPGRFFDAPDRVRVSLGRSPERGAAALRAFGEVLDRT
jgi:aspartate/methionine/tyrosine aminotransferase